MYKIVDSEINNERLLLRFIHHFNLVMFVSMFVIRINHFNMCMHYIYQLHCISCT